MVYPCGSGAFGYWCHTFKWVNTEGNFVYIKYHYLAKHGQKQFTADDATVLSGQDPDYSKRELREAMENGEEVEWTAKIHIMQPHEADATLLGLDPFDVAKVWPRAPFPMHEFGRLFLNKNPENFHRDVEQAAFSPGSMVPGIEDSPDPLLQFRMFFYRDVQRHRIGVNLHQVPVNCPFMASSYSSLNFGGATRNGANHALNPQCVLNSFKHKFRPYIADAPYAFADNIVSRKSHYHHEGKLSDYDQARELYTRVMTEQQWANLHSITAGLLKNVTAKVIKVGYLTQIYNIDPAYPRAIYDLLPEKARSGEEGLTFDEVVEKSKGAEVAGKEAKFRPSTQAERLVGFAPEMAVYNI